jgi:predicted DNA-binding protein with PD1-like motif
MSAATSEARFAAVRLTPGEDLRAGIEAAFAATGARAGFIAAAVGSLGPAALRYAGEEGAATVDGPLEIVALSGTLSVDGAHLHLAVSRADGTVAGGHLLPGSVVRTTAEVVLGLLPGLAFDRPVDPATGYRELRVRAGRP